MIGFCVLSKIRIKSRFKLTPTVQRPHDSGETSTRRGQREWVVLGDGKALNAREKYIGGPLDSASLSVQAAWPRVPQNSSIGQPQISAAVGNTDL